MNFCEFWFILIWNAILHPVCYLISNTIQVHEWKWNSKRHSKLNSKCRTTVCHRPPNAPHPKLLWKNITLPYLLCSWQFTLTWEDWPSGTSPLFPPSLKLAWGACVWLSARVSMCGADGFRRAGCHTRKRGPVTHSERPYVCLRELNASGRGSRQKTLGEQWGVITQAPWLINRESGAPGPLTDGRREPPADVGV